MGSVRRTRVSSLAGISSAGALDWLAQPFHGEFDILRLQVSPTLDLGLVAVLREALEIILLPAFWQPCAPW
jgi:hypothetical protein